LATLYHENKARSRTSSGIGPQLGRKLRAKDDRRLHDVTPFFFSIARTMSSGVMGNSVKRTLVDGKRR